MPPFHFAGWPPPLAAGLSATPEPIPLLTAPSNTQSVLPTLLLPAFPSSTPHSPHTVSANLPASTPLLLCFLRTAQRTPSPSPPLTTRRSPRDACSTLARVLAHSPSLSHLSTPALAQDQTVSSQPGPLSLALPPLAPLLPARSSPTPATRSLLPPLSPAPPLLLSTQTLSSAPRAASLSLLTSASS